MNLQVTKQQTMQLQSSGATGNPRNKVILTPGHSLMDWIRLGKSGNDLTGTGGKVLDVTPEELAKHNKKEDAWMALKGHVYNITPYMDFHPGGVDELMRGAGIDATQLFDEVHKWVNYESMLKTCYVGKMTASPKMGPPKPKGFLQFKNPLLSLSAQLRAKGSSQPSSPDHSKPRYDWFQTNETVAIVIYTKALHMRHENIIIEKTERHMKLSVLMEEFTYIIHVELEEIVATEYSVKVNSATGKVDVTLQKEMPVTQWGSLGQPLKGNDTLIKTDNSRVFRNCVLEGIHSITHDTNLYCFGLPLGTRMCVPLGYHVTVKVNISGMDVVRNYTVVPPSLLKDKQDKRVALGQVLYLMIKIYPDGVVTQHIASLRIGDELLISNPDGNFDEGRLSRCTDLALYAAGTGFTPMAGLLLYANSLRPNPNRSIFLMFFNKEEKDIFWRDQLDLLAGSSDRIKVTYVLSQPHKTWTGLRGRIRQELLQDHIPTPDPERNILFCCCGPTPFTTEAIRLAGECGYSDKMTHAFIS